MEFVFLCVQEYKKRRRFELDMREACLRFVVPDHGRNASENSQKERIDV